MVPQGGGIHHPLPGTSPTIRPHRSLPQTTGLTAKFVKAVPPDPGSLGPLTNGKTCIGVVARGLKGGVRRQVYAYNICDHEEAYRETNSQAISYTTGVPAAVGAMMMLTGKWRGAGVFNMEQFDPEPFLDTVSRVGLPWVAVEQEGGKSMRPGSQPAGPRRAGPG